MDFFNFSHIYIHSPGAYLPSYLNILAYKKMGFLEFKVSFWLSRCYGHIFHCIAKCVIVSKCFSEQFLTCSHCAVPCPSSMQVFPTGQGFLSTAQGSIYTHSPLAPHSYFSLHAQPGIPKNILHFWFSPQPPFLSSQEVGFCKKNFENGLQGGFLKTHLKEIGISWD